MSRLLESYGFEVVQAGAPDEQFLAGLEMIEHELLVIDQDEDKPAQLPNGAERLRHWHRPVLMNDSMATRVSLQQGDPEFGRVLVGRICTLLTGDDT